MTRALAGLDLNGWWDWAAHPGESRPLLVDGGIHGSVVRLEREGRFVAGKQAILAPHGKGEGWGSLGDRSYRRTLRQLLFGEDGGAGDWPVPEAVEAVVSSLAPDARRRVFAIPDNATFTDIDQERFLRLLRRSGTQIDLLWAPIAALLGWLAENEPPCRDITRAGVLLLGGEGVTVATVRLVHEQACIVPERSRQGLLLAEGFAGRKLAARAAEAMGNAAFGAQRLLEDATAPWRLACGQSCRPNEALRLRNRSWRLLPVPDAGPLEPPIFSPAEIGSLIASSQILLVAGPCSENAAWRRNVLQGLGLAENDPRLRFGSARTVARGCLEAAERLDRGDPAYYDFLPRLEILALQQGIPQFIDLVPQGERVQGGKRYTRTLSGQYELVAGQKKVEFYLAKEGDSVVRRWDVPLDPAPEAAAAVDVLVEQRPARGRAQVRLAAPGYAPWALTPVVLNWDEMQPVEESREALLARIEADGIGGAVPKAEDAPGHAVHWHPHHPHGSLVELLRRYATVEPPTNGHPSPIWLHTVTELRGRFRTRQAPGFVAHALGIGPDDQTPLHALSSNGDLPGVGDHWPLPEDSTAALDAALARAAEDLERLLPYQGVHEAKTALRLIVGFCTWCFARCPEQVVEYLLQSVEGETPLNWILALQGLGRTLTDDARMARFLDVCQRAQPLNNNHVTALGFLLAHRERAAGLLTAATAGTFARHGRHVINGVLVQPPPRLYTRRLKFALLMEAALLRVRIRHRSFLMPAVSPEGRALEQTLDRLKSLLTEDLHQQPQLQLLLDIVTNLLDYLRGQGNEPSLLRMIEEAIDNDEGD